MISIYADREKNEWTFDNTQKNNNTTWSPDEVSKRRASLPDLSSDAFSKRRASLPDLPDRAPISWSKPEARARSPEGERPSLAQASIEFQDSGRHKGGLSQRADRLSPVNSNGRVGTAAKTMWPMNPHEWAKEIRPKEPVPVWPDCAFGTMYIKSWPEPLASSPPSSLSSPQSRHGRSNRLSPLRPPASRQSRADTCSSPNRLTSSPARARSPDEEETLRRLSTAYFRERNANAEHTFNPRTSGLTQSRQTWWCHQRGPKEHWPRLTLSNP